jgi:hypothetical protein
MNGKAELLRYYQIDDTELNEENGRILDNNRAGGYVTRERAANGLARSIGSLW